MFAIRMDKSVTLKNQKHPVVLQVVYNRTARRKRLGIEASLDQWNFDDHEFRKGSHNRNERYAALSESFAKAEKIKTKYFESRPFNYRKFIELSDQDAVTEMKVRDFVLQVYEDKVRKGKVQSG